MSDEHQETPAEPVAENEPTKPTDEGRERSRIAFPYSPLPEAIAVANTIHANVGTGECSDEQLAPWLDLSPKSSGYRVRISSTRLFGLIEPGQERAYQLTALGNRIVDPAQKDRAAVEAFLNVPLYKEVYEKKKGGVLPPPSAFEKELASLGVAWKQRIRARQVLEKSAEEARFFEQGRNRLVEPGFQKQNAISQPSVPEAHDTAPDQLDLHPFVRGLLEELPPPGSDWPTRQRVKWLTLAANAFGMIYEDENGGGEIDIKVKLEDQ